MAKEKKEIQRITLFLSKRFLRKMRKEELTIVQAVQIAVDAWVNLEVEEEQACNT